MPTIHKTRFTELGYWKVEDGCWSVVDLSDLSRPAQVGQKYPTKEMLLANLENYAAEYGCELANKPVLPLLDLDRMTWEQMAEIIHKICVEANTRNPIGINFYIPYLIQAEKALLEIAGGEKDNPSSECGPTMAPEYADTVAPFGWEPAPQWAKDAKASDGAK